MDLFKIALCGIGVFVIVFMPHTATDVSIILYVRIFVHTEVKVLVSTGVKTTRNAH